MKVQNHMIGVRLKNNYCQIQLTQAFQIYGHIVHEKRSPAFMNDPAQAIVLAPLFVYIQCFFMAGLFPKTRKRLEAKTLKALAIYKKAKSLRK